jgi:hypothetical protein
MDPFFALVTPLDKEFSPVLPGQPGVPHPSNPIANVGTPENPIVIPPSGVGPGLPDKPVWFPPDPDYDIDTGHRPTNPIVFPPGLGGGDYPSNALPPTPGLPPIVPTRPIIVHPGHDLPKPPEGAAKGADAVVVLLPPNRMAVPPGAPPDSVPAILWYGPGSLPVQVWLPPEAAKKYEVKEPKGKKGSKEEQDEREAEARYQGGSKAAAQK